jgi:hypothetical protein
MMPETRLKLNLFHSRKGEQLEAVEMYYVLGRKPAGGTVARVLVTEDLEVKAGDALVFDFTNQPVPARPTL